MSILRRAADYELSRGTVPGYSVVHKFGKGVVTTNYTPVTNSGFYRTPTTATALEFVSDNIADGVAGAGAREVTVTGLDENWLEVTQTVTTNGTTAVALTTNLTRLFRWYVSSSGTYASQSGGSHVGELTIQGTGGGDVWTTIPTGDFPVAQSQIGAYTIPKGKTGFILSQHAHIDSNKTGDFIFFQRDNCDDVSAPYAGAMRVLNQFIGVSEDEELTPLTPVNGLVGPCDVGYMAKVTTGTSSTSVDFELLIVDDA